MKNLLLAIGIVLLTLVNASVTYGQKTLLFKISGNGLTKPSYVFGTMHMVCTDTYQIPAIVKNAVTKTDVIYTEVEIANMQAAAVGAMKYMIAQPDSALDKVLSEVDFKKVSSFVLDTLGMPIDQLKMFKPNAIATIGLQKAAPCAPFSSVEELLIAAYPAKKNKGLESIAYQMQLLMSAPIPEQAKILLKTIDKWNLGKAEIKQMVDAYTATDLALVASLINSSETSDMMNKETMIDGRNKNWVKKMPALMKKQSVFFAVGAGHLPGKLGVLELLKAKGYTVTPVAIN
jgi:uncharacterized protein YbaP (TraB family)